MSYRLPAAFLLAALGCATAHAAAAACNVGMEVVARSAPDGYTIMLGSVGLVAINPVVFPKFPVIPLRDFIGIMSDQRVSCAVPRVLEVRVRAVR